MVLFFCKLPLRGRQFGIYISWLLETATLKTHIFVEIDGALTITTARVIYCNEAEYKSAHKCVLLGIGLRGTEYFCYFLLGKCRLWGECPLARATLASLHFYDIEPLGLILSGGNNIYLAPLRAPPTICPITLHHHIAPALQELHGSILCPLPEI